MMMSSRKKRDNMLNWATSKRSIVNVAIPKMEYSPCNPGEEMSVICVESGNGDGVAQALMNLFPVIEQPDSVRDALILFWHDCYYQIARSSEHEHRGEHEDLVT